MDRMFGGDKQGGEMNHNYFKKEVKSNVINRLNYQSGSTMLI